MLLGVYVMQVQALFGVFQHVADELDAVVVHVFRALEEVAPHAGRGGEVREGTAEGFNGQPAVIADAHQLVDRLAAGSVTGAGSAAVVFRDVHVVELAVSMQPTASFSSMFAWKVSYIVPKFG